MQSKQSRLKIHHQKCFIYFCSSDISITEMYRYQIEYVTIVRFDLCDEQDESS